MLWPTSERHIPQRGTFEFGVILEWVAYLGPIGTEA
jgi:hypothetical protein